MDNSLLSDFRQAYRNLTFLPLIKEEDINKFGVEYGTQVIEELQQLIEDNYEQNSKVVLAKHRGCGKPTLLAEFKRKLDDRYFITFFSISDLIEMSDVNHINILFAIAVNLMAEAENQSIKIKNSIKQKFYSWFAEHTQTNIEEFKAEVETGFKFDTNECCRICLRLVRREPDNQDIKINQDILEQAINKLSLDFDSRIGVKDYEILKTTLLLSTINFVQVLIYILLPFTT